MDSLHRDVARLAEQLKLLTATSALQANQIAVLRQNLAAVNAKTQRVAGSVGGLAAGANTDVSITWPNMWPDTGYGVIATIVSGTAALGSLTATLKNGTKSVTDCVVTVANTGAGAVGAFALDVIGIRT